MGVGLGVEVTVVVLVTVGTGVLGGGGAPLRLVVVADGLGEGLRPFADGVATGRCGDGAGARRRACAGRLELGETTAGFCDRPSWCGVLRASVAAPAPSAPAMASAAVRYGTRRRGGGTTTMGGSAITEGTSVHSAATARTAA